MKTEFTPGPWWVGAMNDALFVINEAPRPTAEYHNPTLKTKCIATPNMIDFTFSQMQANAYLIAAAPDMYEALEEAREWFYDRTDIDDEGRPNKAMRLVAQIDAALAKANGGAA